MHIFSQIGHVKAYLKEQRSSQSSIGLVPTMGALHAGHMSLIRASKSENTRTICSIYVNPAQFNNAEDLNKYPRTPDEDIRLLREAGCDAVFRPGDQDMYSYNHPLTFDFGALDKILEGEFRPGHFSGVALVVSKLFHIIQPDHAYFGQKDFQQFRIITRLTEELKFDITLVSVPIVREANGLAMSSRNIRLTEAERARAVALHRSLILTRDKLLQGEKFPDITKEVASLCNQHQVKLEYLALADRETLVLQEMVTDPVRLVILIAGWVGDVRLIDNLFLTED